MKRRAITKERGETLARQRSVTSIGMSLIELLVTVAVLAVLIGLAVPGYQRYAMRGYRVAAIELMLDAARCQEGLRATAFRYDTSQCARFDPNERYDLTYVPPDTADTLAFRIVATPLGAQTEDRCGALGLDQSGLRTASGGYGVAVCWAGR